jgi:hypothetical protein
LYAKLDAIAQRVSDGDYPERQDYLTDVYGLLREAVGDVCTLLSSVANASCSVSLKLAWLTQEDEPAIVSFIRDPITAVARTHYRPPDLFHPSENTAFEYLLYSDCEDYFSAENLLSLAALGAYKNSNPYWKILYNSTAVSPIKAQNGTCKIVGFLCADSKSGNLSLKATHGARVRDILVGFSDLLYYAIRASYDEFGNSERVFGWVPSVDGPKPVDAEMQRGLQETLRLMESLYLQSSQEAMRERLLPASPGGGHAPRYHQGVRVMPKEESIEEAWGMSPSDQSDLRLKSLPEETSEEEFVELLEEIAPFDDYAKELLERAKKMGMGTKKT